MNVTRIKAALDASPFRPFSLLTTGGRRYPVSHPELVILMPGGRTVIVADPKADAVDIIDAFMIESLEVAVQGTRRRRSA